MTEEIKVTEKLFNPDERPEGDDRQHPCCPDCGGQLFQPGPPWDWVCKACEATWPEDGKFKWQDFKAMK